MKRFLTTLLAFSFLTTGLGLIASAPAQAQHAKKPAAKKVVRKSWKKSKAHKAHAKKAKFHKKVHAH